MSTEVNPGLVLARISGFGQTAPYASRSGYAALAEATGDLAMGFVPAQEGETTVAGFLLAELEEQAA